VASDVYSVARALREGYRAVPGWPGYYVNREGSVLSSRLESGEEWPFTRPVKTELAKAGYRTVRLRQGREVRLRLDDVIVSAFGEEARPKGPRRRSVGLEE